MSKQKNMLIGEMLVEEGIITKEQLKDGLEEQKRTGQKIGEILVRMGYISKEILWTFLGYQMGVPFINLDEVADIKQDILKLLPESLMRNEKLIPVSRHGRIITVAMSNPLNFLVIDDLKATTRSEIEVRLAPPEDIKKLVDKYFGFREEQTGAVAKAQVDQLDDILSAPIGGSRQPAFGQNAGFSQQPSSYSAESGMKIQRSVYGEQPQPAYAPPPPAYAPPPPPQPAYTPPPQPSYAPPPPPPVPQPLPPIQETPSMAQAVVSQDTPVNVFLTTLLSGGYDSGATDIHIEPFADRCRIRRRIDGALYEVESPPRTLYNGLLNKIKELAQMNPNEKNSPQESKLKIRVSGREINMAVNTFPTLFGEKIVLRIVRTDNVVLKLDETGMEEEFVDAYKKAIKKPHGLVLLSGPTNSGKETTMQSTLNEINEPSMNVFSVDDISANYIIPGINQTKVNRKSFGQVLNMLSEQDCDVITVGDIPNKETAEAVFDVIAGGHLVIAKMRASDPFQALQSVINFGVEPYIVYSNTVAAVSQRLMRKICTGCRDSYKASPEIVSMLGGTADKEVML